jgi:magnesium-transporting ATPase (P-type)
MIFQVNCIVFDKTGTLTIGKPLVVSTRLLKNLALRDFYELVAAAEVSFSPYMNSLLECLLTIQSKSLAILVSLLRSIENLG